MNEIERPVVGYARVSTEEQVKSGSLEAQVEAIKQFCEARGFKLLGIFKDGGISSFAERPEREKVLKLAREGKCGAVIVTSLDRWGRSVKDLVITLDQLKQWGVAFISTDGRIDTSTPEGRLLFYILSAFSEFERELIRERLAAGRERAKAAGKTLHRPRKELPLKEIKRLYTEVGLSASAIAKLLQVSPHTILSRLREMGVPIR
jgi:putative DNA-invertase from lambdoid prophage Rac